MLLLLVFTIDFSVWFNINLFPDLVVLFYSLFTAVRPFNIELVQQSSFFGETVSKLLFKFLFWSLLIGPEKRIFNTFNIQWEWFYSQTEFKSEKIIRNERKKDGPTIWQTSTCDLGFLHFFWNDCVCVTYAKRCVDARKTHSIYNHIT